MVVELDPEALQELASAVPSQRAVCQPLFVKGVQVLVKTARVERIPGVELGDHAQMHEPVGLQRFPEVPGRVLRHPRTHLGDAQQFGSAVRGAVRPLGASRLPGLPDLLSHFPCKLGVAPRENADRIGADVHSTQLLRFRLRLRIDRVVQCGQARRDLRSELLEPFAVDLVVGHSVARGALLHKLCENAGLICGFPFIGHLTEDEIAH